MHENLKIAGIVCCLTAALLFNARLSIALDSTFAEKYGANGIAGGPAEGWTSGREGTVHAKTGKTPQPYSPRTSVNLPFYEKKLAEHDARIARNPDDATLYINKAIFQRMNLDVIGKVRTLERALKRKNLVTEGSELEDIHFDLAILYGPLGVYEKVYYHLRALHQIDRDYFLKAENGLEKYSGLIENSSP